MQRVSLHGLQHLPPLHAHDRGVLLRPQAQNEDQRLLAAVQRVPGQEGHEPRLHGLEWGLQSPVRPVGVREGAAQARPKPAAVGEAVGHLRRRHQSECRASPRVVHGQQQTICGPAPERGAHAHRGGALPRGVDGQTAAEGDAGRVRRGRQPAASLRQPGCGDAADGFSAAQSLVFL